MTDRRVSRRLLRGTALLLSMAAALLLALPGVWPESETDSTVESQKTGKPARMTGTPGAERGKIASKVSRFSVVNENGPNQIRLVLGGYRTDFEARLATMKATGEYDELFAYLQKARLEQNVTKAAIAGVSWLPEWRPLLGLYLLYVDDLDWRLNGFFEQVESGCDD